MPSLNSNAIVFPWGIKSSMWGRDFGFSTQIKHSSHAFFSVLEKIPWSHISLLPVKEKRGLQFFNREHSRPAQQLFGSFSGHAS